MRQARMIPARFLLACRRVAVAGSRGVWLCPPCALVIVAGLGLQFATKDWTAKPLVQDADSSYTGYLS